MTLDGVDIPDDMEWVDRFQSTQLDQSVETALSGALIVETGTRLTGKPVTLSSGRDSDGRYFGVATLAEVEALKAIETADREMTLTLHEGDELTVTWRATDGVPIEAEPMMWCWPDDNADKYLLTLRLMVI